MIPPTDEDRARWCEDALETSTCPKCERSGIDLREAGMLDLSQDDPRCTACDEWLDDGACDPSDDECGHCGFPKFDCKCDDDWEVDGEDAYP